MSTMPPSIDEGADLIITFVCEIYRNQHFEYQAVKKYEDYTLQNLNDLVC